MSSKLNDDGPPPMETLDDDDHDGGGPPPVENLSISDKEKEHNDSGENQKAASVPSTKGGQGKQKSPKQKQPKQQQQQQKQQPQCVYHKHVSLKGRTSDPLLLDYDLAVTEFKQGVAYARQGNFSKAQECIASAFLRNENSIQHVECLPSALLSEEYDDASIHVMEHALFLRLLDHPHEELIVFLIMQLCAGAILGRHAEEGQKRLNIAIKSGEKLLQMYDANEWNDNMKDSVKTLYGTLQRWRLNRHQSALHSAVGNFLMAYTELDAALLNCPTDNIPACCQVRFDLATLSVTCQLKPLPECFQMLFQVVTDAVIHNEYYDTKCLPVCYAYLAFIASKNPAILPPKLIITSVDAFMLMEESDRCQERYQELNNNNNNTDTNNANNKNFQNDGPSIERLRTKMEFLKLIGDPKHIAVWKAFDQQRLKTVAVNNATNIWTSKRQTKCLTCHTKSECVGSLSKCTRCKVSLYCSKECQRKDWPIHKNYCKQMHY